MLEKAHARGVYDHLIVGELTAQLESAAESYDLIASADTLVYFGDLQAILAAAAVALRPRGILIFTTERAGRSDPEGRGFLLQANGRYCHTEDYLRSALAQAGFSVSEVTFVVLRLEGGRPVHGILVSSRKNAVSSGQAQQAESGKGARLGR
jgi:predicted TPR repeat methyltransferase